ncbi:DMT family transporter [Desulfobulbus oligotrophicus]|uniref:EamA family transporter n=1 Tax=Desulfobulbus oligotrophicus TaxID=1909699 RepID=A0A7T6APX7_9BACT|nr:DMT family transporter [Desulfobulbus oligotrophicus]QQG64983.1 EamA family transporter [Desulfobulbus oligotrophicus]
MSTRKKLRPAVSRRATATLLTCLVILFWGGAASAFKIGLRHVDPFSLLLYATAISTLSLLLLLLVRGRSAGLTVVPVSAVWRALLLGILNPFCYYLVLFAAYARLPGQVAMALNYGWPVVLTLLAAPILGQSLKKRQLAAIGVSFIGAIIIATRGQFIGFGELSGSGLLLTAGSTVIWAFFWLLNTKDDVDPVLKLFLGFCSGLVCTLLVSPLFGGFVRPPQAAWPALIYIGLFEMGMTFVLWMTALKLSSSTARLSNLIYLTPFLSLLFLHLFIDEQIHPATFIGLFLIVVSLLYQEWTAHRTQ